MQVSVAAEHVGPVAITLNVDGHCLGYGTVVDPGDDPDLCGASEYKDGVATTTALRFKNPTISAFAAAPIDNRDSIMGKVTVNLFLEGHRSGNEKTVQLCKSNSGL